MDFFDKMKDSVSMTGQKVSQKAKTATESLRISNQIKANDKMMEKLTYQVGVQCVNSHLHEENTEYKELFAEIRRLRAENQSWEEELQKLTAVSTCPQCGAANNPDSRFCNSCGAILSGGQEPVEGKSCGNCGVKNEKDAGFCSNCGNPLT